jgi:hypothetical protein
MYVKLRVLLVFILLSIKCFSQTYSYSYVDPCTHVTKTIQVPSTGIAVTYYGQIHVFQPSDFGNGTFDSWTSSVYSTFGGGNPCSLIIGIPKSINIAQNTAINLISITTSITAISDFSQTNILNGTLSSISEQPNSKKSKKDLNEGKTSGKLEDPSSKKKMENGKTSTEGEVEDPNSNKRIEDGKKSIEGEVEDPNAKKKTEDGPTTNLTGGTTNALSNLQSASSKNGNRPTIIASSDLVGFNFKNAEVSAGGKFTGGYTSLRWDGMRTHGILVDYTTATKGPNVTGFYGWIKTKHTNLLATTLSVGFDLKPSIYITTAYGQLWNLNRSKNFKGVVMASVSYGTVYAQQFLGTALLTGCVYDWRVSKRYQIKLMGLYVYSPYVSYYNDMLLKSQHVIIPIVGTNIGITRRFKININGGGAWAINDQTLNYTIMMGTRLML